MVMISVWTMLGSLGFAGGAGGSCLVRNRATELMVAWTFSSAAAIGGVDGVGDTMNDVADRW